MDFIDWLNSHDPKQLSTEAARFGEHDVSFLAYLFQVARANGQDFIRESRDVIGYIEVKLHSFWRFKGGELDEETVPDCLQMLRYFIIDVQEVTKSTIAVMKGRFARPEVDGRLRVLLKDICSTILRLTLLTRSFGDPTSYATK